MNYTENYQLNQWEQTDRILMEDFNSDNQKIEEALESLDLNKVEIVTGTYVGNGSAERNIVLGFQPKVVILASSGGIYNTTAGMYGGIGISGQSMATFTINANGFTVYEPGGYSNIHTNFNGDSYQYIAFRVG